MGDPHHAAKAREAGVEELSDEKPPVSKKCFLFLVFILLSGGIIAIVSVLKSGKNAEAEKMETTTTAKPTTVPIAKLTDETEILARCKNTYTAKLGKSSIGTLPSRTGTNFLEFFKNVLNNRIYSSYNLSIRLVETFKKYIG